MTNTMRAVVLDAPEPPEALQIRDLPIPTTQPGQVLIKVEAFGLAARSSTLGSALPRGVTFPRVLGIEATGTVADSPGGEFVTGQQVAAMMGGMGRTFDGGYAEYTCVPVQQVVPFTSSLDWDSRGAGDAPDVPRIAHRRASTPSQGSRSSSAVARRRSAWRPPCSPGGSA